MIVFHSFFDKKHPKYLDRTVGMMRNMNNCCFVNHRDLDVFINKLRETLKEDSDGRYEKNEVSLYVGNISSYCRNGLLKINVKGGLDYAARIDYIEVGKGYFYRTFSENIVHGWNFTPDGEMVFINKDNPE